MARKKTDAELLAEAEALDAAYARAEAFDAERALSDLRTALNNLSIAAHAVLDEIVSEHEIFQDLAAATAEADEALRTEDEMAELRKAALSRGRP